MVAWLSLSSALFSLLFVGGHNSLSINLAEKLVIVRQLFLSFGSSLTPRVRIKLLIMVKYFMILCRAISAVHAIDEVKLIHQSRVTILELLFLIH